MTTSPMTTTSARMSPMRKTALAAGLLYIATFVFSIPALAFYDDVVNNPDFVLGAGNGGGVLWGGLIEVITAPHRHRHGARAVPSCQATRPNRAVGFVAFRVLEASMIFVGVISLLGVFTLRQDFAGGDGTAVTAAASALVAVKRVDVPPRPRPDARLQRLLPGHGAVSLPARAPHHPDHRPRRCPDPARLLRRHAVRCLRPGLRSGTLLALPIAVWEFSLGVWLTVKGFTSSSAGESPASDGSASVADVPALAG